VRAALAVWDLEQQPSAPPIEVPAAVSDAAAALWAAALGAAEASIAAARDAVAGGSSAPRCEWARIPPPLCATIFRRRCSW
jgi:hypothetical protein